MNVPVDLGNVAIIFILINNIIITPLSMKREVIYCSELSLI